VLILEEVKVICFHTLLQVLILKVVVAVFCDLRKMRSGQAPRGSGQAGKPLDARGKQESLAASKLDLPDSKGLDFLGDDQESARE
jgi:hypothetical protein